MYDLSAHTILGAATAAFLAQRQTMDEMIAASKEKLDIAAFAKSKRLRTASWAVLGGIVFGLMAWFFRDEKIVYKK